MTNEPFRIFVYLPTDRWKPGFLRLFDPNGTKMLYDMPCRGKADGGRATKEGNPARDPAKPFGDTPSGLYRPSRITRFSPSHKTLGPLAILLEGQTGEALKAAQQGRTGLALHGGRGDDQLMATHGCIRVFDRDMALLAGAIGDAPVKLEVFSVADWPHYESMEA